MHRVGNALPSRHLPDGEAEQRSEFYQILLDRRLQVVFQPMVQLASGEIYGYEALIRGPADSVLHHPVYLFEAAFHTGRLYDLDVLCRELAMERFADLNLSGRLFLNVNPNTLIDPSYRGGATRDLAKRFGIKPKQVVIEITEYQPILDYQVFSRAVSHYREHGFKVAIDDLGGGYNSLRLWTEIKPEFVKIDRQFVTNIDQDNTKRALIQSLHTLSLQFKTTMVVEGIERAEEFALLRELGIGFGQGYYFCRPLPEPPTRIESEVFRVDTAKVSRGTRQGYWVGQLAQPTPALGSLTRTDQVAEYFIEDDDRHYIPLVDDGRVQGIVWRGEFMSLMAGRFGRDLHGRKPVRMFMDDFPVVVDADLHIEQVSRQITERGDNFNAEAFVITRQGQYLGTATFIDLLRAITDLQIKNARYANPLTLLPGNVPINETMVEWLGTHDFVVGYVDLDSFKAYNDVYGYKRGDDAIRLVADILRQEMSPDADFIGHIGGDDFIVLIRSPDWRRRIDAVLSEFGRQTPDFYSEEDRARGGIEATDRQGQKQFFPLMSLSIAVIPSPVGRFQSPYEVAGVASECKKMAKAIPGNAMFVDRRGNPGEEETSPETPSPDL